MNTLQVCFNLAIEELLNPVTIAKTVL